MKKTIEERLEDNLRIAVFRDKKLNKKNLFLAKVFLEQSLGNNFFKSNKAFVIPKTWNIKLYSNYVILQDMLVNFDFENNFSKKDEKLISILKQLFVIKSLRQDTDERKYFPVREKVIAYFKKAIFLDNPHGEFIYKSNKMSIRVSFKQKTVSIKEYKSNKIYIKDIDIEELDLFPAIKALI